MHLSKENLIKSTTRLQFMRMSSVIIMRVSRYPKVENSIRAEPSRAFIKSSRREARRCYRFKILPSGLMGPCEISIRITCRTRSVSKDSSKWTRGPRSSRARRGSGGSQPWSTCPRYLDRLSPITTTPIWSGMTCPRSKCNTSNI